jgi:predicted DCC family thiol-disulfide oxidoreductase YuxK
VKLVLWADARGPLRFAALTSPTAQQVLGAHPELASVDSLVFVSGDAVSVRSSAVLDILAYLGGVWRIPWAIGRLIPREIRDSFYDIVAFWRHRVFGRLDACPLPPPAARHRFLS